jgi:hypothetical protein
MADNGWPKTREELIAEGYKLGNHDHCRGCGRTILWARTPNDRPMPLSAINGEFVQYQAHFSDCPNREQFRRAKAK